MPDWMAMSEGSFMKKQMRGRPANRYSRHRGMLRSHTILTPALKPSLMRWYLPAPMFCAA